MHAPLNVLVVGEEENFGAVLSVSKSVLLKYGLNTSGSESTRDTHWQWGVLALPRQHVKKQRHYFVNKGPSSQGYAFSNGHVWIWELDCEESWAPKNWFFWTVVLGKTLESPLDCKEIQPVHPKGDQSWVFIGRTDVEAETPVLWPPDVKHWHLKRLWCWERLRAGGEGDDRGWDGRMASPTQWTWLWVDSGSWWWTGRPGVLWFMGSPRVGHDWVTELDWTELSPALWLWVRIFERGSQESSFKQNLKLKSDALKPSLGIPWFSSGQNLVLSLPGAGVWPLVKPLVRELRAWKLYSMAKKVAGASLTCIAVDPELPQNWYKKILKLLVTTM